MNASTKLLAIMKKTGPTSFSRNICAERVMQAKFDLAGIFRQGSKAPVTIEVLEGAVQQCHRDQFRRMPDILGSEAVLDMVIIDQDRRMRDGLILGSDR